MATEEGIWEVHAVRYATLAARTRGETFLSPDPHEAAPMPLAYYLWLIRNGERAIVVDTGFEHAEAARRGRTLERLPHAALAMLGVAAATVADVVITHLHYDHAGAPEPFGAARFHLQEAEMAYATGPCMGWAELRRPYAVGHVCRMVEHVFAGRVAFAAGDAALAPGVSLHLLGGHAKGLQVVRVLTRAGPLVLASDAAHYFENFLDERPFRIVHDVEATLRGYRRLLDLAGTPERVVPGHDPLVLARWPASAPALAGIAARLDAPPAGPFPPAAGAARPARPA